MDEVRVIRNILTAHQSKMIELENLLLKVESTSEATSKEFVNSQNGNLIREVTLKNVCDNNNQNSSFMANSIANPQLGARHFIIEADYDSSDVSESDHLQEIKMNESSEMKT